MDIGVWVPEVGTTELVSDPTAASVDETHRGADAVL